MNSRYQIIYADPPWKFKVWSTKGLGRSPDMHYLTQSTTKLQSLNIQSISDTNSVLLLWATFPCLQQAIALGRAWGFQYKTVAFVWVKKNKGNPNLFMGLGYYTRANAEIVLLFTKGKPLKRIRRDVRQVLISPRGAHSRKPAAIRERITDLFGNLRRVELFARDPEGQGDKSLEGWDVFGNEVKNSIEIPFLKQ